MKTSKSDLAKEKSKPKTTCSSKQSSKFLEKEGFNNFSLNFKGLAVSLSDFTPKIDETKGVNELDFDIGKQMKKLEKKDAGTKQKALMDLIDLINNKDNECVVGMLRYWPKMYNKLSVDDDKRVRELNQDLMNNLAKLCGKNLGIYIKQLLPTWIFSQSDVHVPVAELAKKSFINTFPDEIRRQKAYLLCWEDISPMISASINRVPVKEKTHTIPKDNVSIIVKEGNISNKLDNECVIVKEGTSTCKKEKTHSSSKEKSKEVKKEILTDTPTTTVKKVISTPGLDTYVDDIILHLRTLVTLLPYIIHNPTAIEDVTNWIHSKAFWAHYTIGAPTNIIAIYLILTVELLTHVPHLILDVPFVVGHLAEVLRHVDNYHSAIVPLTWTAIIKSVDVIGERLWQHVSFHNKFLPKWLKMLDCGTDGRVSLASSFMLPFFTKLPLNLSLADSTVVYTRIFDSMIKGLNCPRVRHTPHEANSLVTTIFECATYTILGARAASNDSLKDKILSVMWRLLEQYLTDTEYTRADQTVEQFCKVALRPLLNKGVISCSQVTTILTAWIDQYHDRSVYSEHLSELISALGRLHVCDETVLVTLMDALQFALLEKVVNEQHCLLAYLGVLSVLPKIADRSLEHQSRLRHVFANCKEVIAQHSAAVTTTIAMALANILNSMPHDAQHLYEDLMVSLSQQQMDLFFTDYYGPFLTQIDDSIASVVAATTLTLWQTVLSRELKGVLSVEWANSVQEDKVEVQRTLSLALRHCRQSLWHRDHPSQIIALVDGAMARATEDMDTVITLAQYLIDEAQSHFTLDLVPHSMVLSLVKMLVATTSDTSTDLSQVQLYLQYCTANGNNDASIFLQILDQVLLGDTCQIPVAVDIVSAVLHEGLESHGPQIVAHLGDMLARDMIHLDQIMCRQQSYSQTVVHQQQPSLLLVIHKLNFFVNLPLDWHRSLSELRTTVDHCCMLLTPIMLATFPNCHHSSLILQQCQSIYEYTETVMAHSQTHILTQLMTHTTTTATIVDQCSHLVLVALKHFMPTNYSLWSPEVLIAVDQAIDNWTAADLSDRQLSMVFRVFIPSAVKARYLVQEIVLATISSYLSDDVKPTMDHINRAILLVKALVLADSSFFDVCFPLIMSVKRLFEGHIDQLYDASVDRIPRGAQFDLSSLLEILIVGVESSPSLSQSQWDFVLCLVSVLSRSPQFVNSGDFATEPVSDTDTDHILNSYLLLRLIANVAIALASVSNESVLDEWDNLFAEPIFVTVLDMFSLVAGDHSQGRLVSSDLFTFYTEALAEVVSLCPISVLLTHNFSSQIHINDPIELPKDFLLVFNSLLDSLSSYSLSTQLAAYNCLLNLTDHLSGLLLDQITRLESDDNLESFSIGLPHKLLSYLQSDELSHMTVDKLQNEVVLTRCFLAWSVLLQLFSCSQPKVRAEISTFLATHNRCFDRFLSFCYAFMPNSPLVSKKHLTFLAVHGTQCCNLICEEPQIFSKCLEKRTKFIIYHLSSYVFRRSVQVLPNLARGWFMSLDVNSQQNVDIYVRQYITPELFKIEFRLLKDAVGKDFDEKLEIQALSMIGEVTVRYIVPGDQCLEQVITMPNNYPIGKISVDFKKEMSVKIPHWKSWIIQMASTMQNQNGSIVDGVKLWKKNLDNHFDGIEECMICYSILHALKYTLPSMKCRQCKKKFHKDCMYKWFQSSTNPTCPNCRNVFYDGTYKRAQYGDSDI